MGCFDTPIIFIALFFVVLAFIFTRQTASLSGGDDFYIGPGYIRNPGPYYSFAGGYSGCREVRLNKYCLAQNADFEGYRKCMLQ